MWKELFKDAEFVEVFNSLPVWISVKSECEFPEFTDDLDFFDTYNVIDD